MKKKKITDGKRQYANGFVDEKELEDSIKKEINKEITSKKVVK